MNAACESSAVTVGKVYIGRSNASNKCCVVVKLLWVPSIFPGVRRPRNNRRTEIGTGRIT